MSTIPPVVTPAGAAGAYARTDRGEMGIGAGAGGFGATLQRALENAVQVGHVADERATQAIGGHGNLTDVVTALAQAELTLRPCGTLGSSQGQIGTSSPRSSACWSRSGPEPGISRGMT